MARSPNQILASLSSATFAAIKPHLKTVELMHGETLTEPGSDVRCVYFPRSGVISLVVQLNVGEMIETAMVGRDGVFNARQLSTKKVSLNKAIVQLAGMASAIAVDPFRKIAREFEPFRSLLIRHEQVLLAQSQQSAACNANHSVEARMCRWLLRLMHLHFNRRSDYVF